MTTDHLDTRGWLKVSESRDRIVKRRAEKEEEEEEEESELKDGNNEDLFSVLVSNEACIGSFRQPIGRESATFANNDAFSVCVSPPLPLPVGREGQEEEKSRSRIVENIQRMYARLEWFECKLDAFLSPLLLNPFHIP